MTFFSNMDEKPDSDPNLMMLLFQKTSNVSWIQGLSSLQLGPFNNSS